VSIGKEIVNGVFWNAIQRYSGIFVQICVTSLLARLLCPEDFGVVAIASVFINFFSLFTDMGIGTAIVQNQELSKKDLDFIFSFCIYCGVVLSGLFFCSSRLIGAAYKNESLIGICNLLSVNLLLASWNIVPNALLYKNKRFKFIAQRTLGLQVLCGVVSVVAAFCGLGMYALVISPIVTSIGLFILNYRQYPLRFTCLIDFQSLKKIGSFSVYQFLFNFINYFSRNLDKLIVGKSFSMNELGYYEKSYRLMMFPLQNITYVITPVMHPVLTALQNDYHELIDKYSKIIKLIAIVSFPLGVFLYFAADGLIALVYGDKWMSVIPVFRILALSVPLQLILSTTGAIYQAAGKTNLLFFAGLINSCCTVTGFSIAAMNFHTLQSIAWAWTITLCINFTVSFTILCKKVLHQSLYGMLNQLIFPMVSGVVLAFMLLMFKYEFESAADYVSLISMTILTGITVLVSGYMICKSEFIWIYKSYKHNVDKK